LLVRGGEHQAADRIVVAGGLQHLDHLGQHLGRERVAGIGLVERERGDARPGDVVADRLVRHPGHPTGERV
jgi:hypothetical protein